jgi:hypothetical protein
MLGFEGFSIGMSDNEGFFDSARWQRTSKAVDTSSENTRKVINVQSK